jgi:long-chain acyl-CoA synthetase
LSHRNLLSDARAALELVPARAQDRFLSFLPLSHALERTAGYYLPMLSGSCVAYARSVQLLAEDMPQVQPTVLITVPRIYERIHRSMDEQLRHKGVLARFLFKRAVDTGWAAFLRDQGEAGWRPSLLLHPLLDALVGRKLRARFGGRIRVLVCGGAPLSTDVARTFIALGLPLLQGYGLTETAPVVSVNRLEDNDPASVGRVLPGVEIRIGEGQELLVRGPTVMAGYWKDAGATRTILGPDGWLHTGDQAQLRNGRLYITGRIKEIIVLTNGEKVPPADIETAIAQDPLFDQVMVVGEARPYLAALLVVDGLRWKELAAGLGLTARQALTDERARVEVRRRIAARMAAFPGYANIRRIHLSLEPWTIENGLLTPTLKLRRKQAMERFSTIIEGLYAGR